jgi:hypothetical protein
VKKKGLLSFGALLQRFLGSGSITKLVIEQDAHAFVRELAQTGIKGIALEAGQSLLFGTTYNGT